MQNENTARDRVNIIDDSMASKYKHVKHGSMTKLGADKVSFNNSMIESSSTNNIVMVSANNAL